MTSNKTKAILLIISSAFGFALMSVFVREAGNLPTMQKAFFRNLIAMLVAGASMWRKGIGIRCGKGNLPMLLARSLCGMVGIFANFYAIDKLSLADATMLNKMSPFFAILSAAILLKEKIGIVQYLAVLGAFGGSLLVIKPGFSADAFPAFIGLCGGIGAGIAFSCVRALSRRGENSGRIVFVFSALSCLVTLPFLLLDYHPMTTVQLLYLLGAGAAGAVGQYGMTLAYAYAEVKDISIFNYSQVIFAALLGFAFFGQKPDGASIVGYVIILGISAAMFFYGRRNAADSP